MRKAAAAAVLVGQKMKKKIFALNKFRSPPKPPFAVDRIQKRFPTALIGQLPCSDTPTILISEDCAQAWPPC